MGEGLGFTADAQEVVTDVEGFFGGGDEDFEAAIDE